MPRRPAAPTDQGPPPRRMRGFEAAGALVQDRIGAAGAKRGFAAARILTHWDEVAGPDLAPLCRPAKIAWGREGLGATLTVLAAPAQAPLVSMARERLRARVNAAYGYNAIGRVVVTQTAADGFAPPAGLAEPPAPSPRPPALPALPVEGIRDPGLRAALEAMARNLASRGAGRAV